MEGKVSTKLPQGTFVVEMQHKYKKGDKVRVVAPFSKLYLYPGEIHKLIPYTFVAPGYYVKFGDDVIAMSERSLEKIETPTPECHS